MCELQKLRIENIKLQKALQTAQDCLAQNGKQNNNTSNKFNLPSEFKNNYEEIIFNMLPQIFLDFVEIPNLLVNLLQDLILIISEFAQDNINKMNIEVINLLQIRESQENIQNQMLNIYQNNYQAIFKLKEQDINLIIQKYQKQTEIILDSVFSNEIYNQQKGDNNFGIPDEYQNYINDLIQNNDLSNLINQFYFCQIYMLLNETQLTFQIQKFQERNLIYKSFIKSNYYCFDGFAKDNSVCLVLIPSIMRNNFVFQGIKPLTLILQNKDITDQIKDEVQKDIQLQIQQEKKKTQNDENYFSSESQINQEETQNNDESIKEKIQILEINNQQKINENLQQKQYEKLELQKIIDKLDEQQQNSLIIHKLIEKQKSKNQNQIHSILFQDTANQSFLLKNENIYNEKIQFPNNEIQIMSNLHQFNFSKDKKELSESQKINTQKSILQYKKYQCSFQLKNNQGKYNFKRYQKRSIDKINLSFD